MKKTFFSNICFCNQNEEIENIFPISNFVLKPVIKKTDNKHKYSILVFNVGHECR